MRSPLAPFLALLLLTACGSDRPSTRRTPPPSTPAAAGHLTLRGSAVARYPGRSGAAPRDAVSRAVAQAAERAAKVARRRVPKLDGRLSAVAADLTGGVREHRLPKQSVIDFAAGHHGVISPIPLGLVIETGASASPRKIADALQANLLGALKRRMYTRLGVGVRRVGDRTVVVVLMQRQRVTLKPFPRVLPAGGKARLAGALRGGLGRPEVHLTDAAGKAHTLRARVKGPAFEVEVRCQGRGEHRVEVMGRDKAGPSIAANFSVWCGDRPPARVALEARVVARDLSADQAARRLFELANAERARLGLPALKWASKLAKVARKHSVDMADHGFVAHISPRTGSPGDRLRRGGLASEVLMENVGLSDSAAGVHEGLMNSPAHRGAILAGEVDQMGVGVVMRAAGDGGRRMYATELFLRTVRPLKQAAGQGALVAAAKRRRLRAHKALMQIAGDAARRFAGGRLNGNAVARWAVGQVKAKRIKMRSLRTLVGVGRDPAALAKKAKGKRFGAGVAVGTQKGQPAYFSVLLVAD